MKKEGPGTSYSAAAAAGRALWAAALAASMLWAGPVLADGARTAEQAGLRPADRDRLDRVETALGRGLRAALAEGSAEDTATLAAALVGKPAPADPGALAGNWTCRTIKTGGPAPLVVYGEFRCRASASPDGQMTFEKLTGSQRVKGEVVTDGDRLLLVGVGYIAGDTPPGYADLPAEVDPAAAQQVLPSPGIIEMTGPDSGRILFPWPLVESDFDILVLRRQPAGTR